MNYINLAAVLLLASLAPARAAEAPPAEAVAVVDPTVLSGETFLFDGVFYRLWGIAAPHRDQHCRDQRGQFRCGRHATLLLRGLLLAAPADCRIIDATAPGALTAPRPVRCRLAGTDVAALLVRAGYAFADRVITDTYLPAERTAQSTRAGLWSTRFQYPWDWQTEATTR